MLERCVVCGKLFEPYWRENWEEQLEDEKHICYECRTQILDALYDEEEPEDDE